MKYLKIKKFFYLNENGMYDIDVIPCILLLISVICFSLDTFMLTPRMNAISEANTYAIRIVEKQGGISPDAFAHIDTESFTTSEILLNNINVMLSNAGFDVSETKVFVNNVLLTSDTTIGPLEYGTEIVVKINGRFPYVFSNCVNPDFYQNVSVNKLGVSTYIIRNN